MNSCPGRDKRFVKAENIICPGCGSLEEIFSDEVKARCLQCKNLIHREKAPSCADWCKKAKECIGE